MSNRIDLVALEQDAYTASFRDGILDVFFGMSVLWIGIAWVWLPDFAALAGIIPAALVVPVVELRKRVVESHSGFVRWSESRRRTESTRVIQLLALGMLLLGAAVVVVLTSTDTLDSIAPALPAGLLGLLAILLGMVSGVWRGLAYGILLLGAGLTTALVGADPGVDMLVSGAGITTTGLVLVATYLTRHPQRPE